MYQYVWRFRMTIGRWHTANTFTCPSVWRYTIIISLAQQIFHAWCFCVHGYRKKFRAKRNLKKKKHLAERSRACRNRGPLYCNFKFKSDKKLYTFRKTLEWWHVSVRYRRWFSKIKLQTVIQHKAVKPLIHGREKLRFMGGGGDTLEK